MDNIFMNSENSKTSDPYRILLNVTDKINLKTSDKYVALSKNELKISVPTWNEEFELPDHYILCQISKTILSLSSKNMRQLLAILQ